MSRQCCEQQGCLCHLQIKQHAPSLKVVMYDGLKASSRELGVDGPDGSPSLGRKRKRKMTKRQKFEFAQVSVVCMLHSEEGCSSNY